MRFLALFLSFPSSLFLKRELFGLLFQDLFFTPAPSYECWLHLFIYLKIWLPWIRLFCMCWCNYLLCCNLPPFCFNNAWNLTAIINVCHNVVVVAVVVSIALCCLSSHLTLRKTNNHLNSKKNKRKPKEMKRAFKHRERSLYVVFFHSFFPF